jgi:hypothetical protein
VAKLFTYSDPSARKARPSMTFNCSSLAHTSSAVAPGFSR